MGDVFPVLAPAPEDVEGRLAEEAGGDEEVDCIINWEGAEDGIVNTRVLRVGISFINNFIALSNNNNFSSKGIV